MLCEEEAAVKPRLKYYFVHLPAIGPRPFRRPELSGWQHHIVLTAVAHAYVQRERMRPHRGPTLTFPAARAIVQDIFTALLFAAKPRYMHWMETAKRTLQLRI